jgi:hypothetical protein
MDIQEYNKCMEILQDKPKWFFQKNNIGLKLECLEKFNMEGAPMHIHSLIPILKNENSKIRLKTAEVILVLFHKLKSQTNFMIH